MDKFDENEEAPKCHFTPMTLESADDWPNGSVIFWECKHCGHTKEFCREYEGY